MSGIIYSKFLHDSGIKLAHRHSGKQAHTIRQIHRQTGIQAYKFSQKIQAHRLTGINRQNTGINSQTGTQSYKLKISFF